MTIKMFSLFLLFALVLVFGTAFINSEYALAQVSSFPTGCNSTIGYSTATGQPCNGTATTSFMAGCNSIFGFSTTTGLACNGGTNAIVATDFFPGCTSIYGFSTVTGRPCNGGINATTSFLPGCTSILGTSTINGAPCNGGTVAYSSVPGCTSVFGYSTTSGAPCNGTFIATLAPGTTPPPSTPGLPTTGAGSLANILMLLGSGTMAAFGLARLSRRS